MSGKIIISKRMIIADPGINQFIRSDIFFSIAMHGGNRWRDRA